MERGRDTLGVWLTIPSVISAEAAARVGYDYVCIDNQHGVNDYQQTVAMAQAILLGGGTPICRVPWNEPGIIGKMLDGGIEGIIVPMVNSVAEAQAVVRAGRYAPMGARSFGPVVAGMRRSNHFDWAGDGIALIPMIETVEAIANLDDILAVPGIDAIYVGPADLSITLGLPPGNNDGRPAVRRRAGDDRGRLPQGRHRARDPCHGGADRATPGAGIPDDHRHQRHVGDEGFARRRSGHRPRCPTRRRPSPGRCTDRHPNLSLSTCWTC